MKKFITLFATLLFEVTFLSAKVITVTSSESSGIGTLRQAIEDAESNDTIVFADNVTTVYFAAIIKLDKSITISGNEANNTVFQNATVWTDNIQNRKRYFSIPAGIEVTFNHITMKDNVGNCSGGAISNYGKLTLNHCTFSNNRSRAQDAGGAIINFGNLSVMNCIFSNNSASLGGAIECFGVASITNSLFIGNYGSHAGGAIRVGSDVNTNISISNCTFAENRAVQSYGGGAAISTSRTTTLYNNIIWNNNNGTDDIFTSDKDMIIAYNNIIGTSNEDLSGNGNIIGKNPLFAGNGNYSLQAGSPAINKGNNAYLDAGITVDLAGNPRINSGMVDMGAYEYQRSVNWGDSLVEVLQDSIAVLQQENGIFQDSILTLQNVITTLQNENSALCDSIIGALQDSIAVLQQKNDVFYDSILTLHMVNSSLQTLSDSVAGVLQDSIAVLEQKNSTFQDSILALLNANSTLQNDNTNLQEENAALQEENAMLRDDNRLLDSIAILHEEIDMLNELYDATVRQWINETRKNTYLQNNNNVLRDSVTMLLNANSALQSNNAILLSENTTLQDSIVVLFNKNSTLQNEHTILQKDYATLLSESRTSRNTIIMLSGENEALRKDNAILLEENAALQDSTIVLLNKIDLLQDSVDVLHNANSTLQNDNTILQNENAILQDSTVVLLDKIDLLQDSIDVLLKYLAECEASGIQSNLISKSNVQVYPNPVYDKLQIVIPSEEQSMFINSVVELFDMSGKCMYSARINAAVDTFVIDMSSQKTGLYILRITQQNKEVSVMKIIKS